MPPDLGGALCKSSEVFDLCHATSSKLLGASQYPLTPTPLLTCAAALERAGATEHLAECRQAGAAEGSPGDAEAGDDGADGAVEVARPPPKHAAALLRLEVTASPS